MNKPSEVVAVVALEAAVALALVLGVHYVLGDKVTEKTVVVTEKKVKVVTEKLTVPRPSTVQYAPLKDPKTACTGAPVVIETVSISAADKDKPNDRTTWLRVRPAGDEYMVACRLGGAWDEMKKGDLVSLVQGQPG